jgi:hypothetical protein
MCHTPVGAGFRSLHLGTGTTQHMCRRTRDDLEIKDYVVLQKLQEQSDRLPPPRTLILYFTFTHS